MKNVPADAVVDHEVGENGDTQGHRLDLGAVFPWEAHVEELETDFVLQDTQANESTKNF
jgi:hypothetical protein